MTFESSQDMGGIIEREGQFFVTDPDTLKAVEERERAMEIELESLEAKVDDILKTLTSQENMSEHLLNLLTKILETSLSKIERLKAGSPTLQ